MKELDAEAKAKDVLLLGECGLDPGIDSMAAMRIMERVQKEGKQVVSFVSWCGGLPEASASNVPLAYKFSWSPKAVLTASLNDAEFKLAGEMRKVAGQDLLREHFPDVKLWRGLALEGLANRDSLPYAEKYGLGEIKDLRDCFRGTLRYQGFAHLMDGFRALGLLGKDKVEAAGSWPGFLAASMSQALGREVKEEDLLAAVEEATGADAELVDALQYFSLLPSESATGAPAPPALPKAPQAPIDTFAALLSKKLAYASDERDAVLLHHAFKVVPGANGVGEQTVTASLLCTGDERASAMSTTVGCTLAFAALRVADGQVQVRGVTGPYTKDVWAGVLDELEHIGVKVKETWV
jgi:alpha-aminoadipic semialdehyde synthase